MPQTSAQPKSILRAIQAGLLIAASLAVVLATDLGAVNSIEIKSFIMTAAGAVIVALGLIRFLGGGKTNLPSGPLLWFSLGIIATVTLAFLLSPFKTVGLAAWAGWMLLGLLFFALYDLFYEAVWGRLALGGVLAGLALACLWGLAQFARKDPTAWQDLALTNFGARILAGSGNPNFFAGFLVLTAPLAGFQIFQNHRARYRFLGGILLALCLLLIPRTGSKAACLALGVQFLLLGHLIWHSDLPGRARRNYLLIWAGAGLAVLALAWMILPLELRQRALGLASKDNESVVFRLNTWSGAWKIFLASPLWGHGPGSFALLYPGFRPEEAMAGAAQHAYEVTHAENWVLQLLGETGLLGFGAFGAWIILLLRPLRQAARKLGQGDNWLPALAAGLLLGLAGSLAENLAALDLFLPGTAFYFTILAALSAARYGGRPLVLKIRLPRVAIGVLSALCLAAACLASVFGQLKERSSVDLKSAELYSNLGVSNDAFKLYESSLSKDPANLEALYFKGQMNFDMAQKNGEGGALPLPGQAQPPTPHLARAEQAWTRLVSLAPDYVLVHDRLARLYAFTGRPGPAQKEWERQRRIDAHFLPAWSDAAQNLFQEKKYAESLALLDEAAKLFPEEASLIANQGTALAALGRLDEAESAFRRLLENNWASRGAHESLAALLEKKGRPREASLEKKISACLDPFFETARPYEIGMQFGRVLQDDPQAKFPRFAMAVFYMRTDRPGQAKAELEALKKSDSQNVCVREMLKKLEKEGK